MDEKNEKSKSRKNELIIGSLFVLWTGLSFFLYPLLFRLGESRLSWYLAEGALYLSFFALMYLLKKSMGIGNILVELSFLATSLLYIQKENKDLLGIFSKEKITQLHWTFFACFLFYYVMSYWKERNFSWEKLEKSFLYIMPIFLLERGYYNMFALYFLVVFVRKIKEKKFLEDFRSLDKRFLGLGFAYLLSICVSSLGHMSTKMSHTQFRIQLFSLLLILFLAMAKLEKKDLDYLAFSFTLGMITPIYANLFAWVRSGFRIQEAISVLENANDWAILLVLISVVLSYLVIEQRRSIHIILYLATLLLIFCTQSRGGILTYLITVILYVLCYSLRLRKFRYLGGVAFFLLASFFYLKNSDSYVSQKFATGFHDYSTVLRIYMRREALRQYREKPILGWGVQTFQDVMTREDLPRSEEEKAHLPEIQSFDHSHNNVLEVLRSFGSYGFVCYVLFYFFLFSRFWKAYWKEKENLFLIPLLSMLAYEIYGQTDISLYMRMPKATITCIIAFFFAFSCRRE